MNVAFTVIAMPVRTCAMVRRWLRRSTHASHPGVFTREELFPFRFASPPLSQLASQQRHGIMRKGRSKKNDVPY